MTWLCLDCLFKILQTDNIDTERIVINRICGITKTKIETDVKVTVFDNYMFIADALF